MEEFNLYKLLEMVVEIRNENNHLGKCVLFANSKDVKSIINELIPYKDEVAIINKYEKPNIVGEIYGCIIIEDDTYLKPNLSLIA